MIGFRNEYEKIEKNIKSINKNLWVRIQVLFLYHPTHVSLILYIIFWLRPWKFSEFMLTLIVMSEKILVVDDDSDLCQVIVDTLKEKGYEATFVQNAEEGLENATNNPPDLILTDLEIPHMGGFVLCQRLRLNPKTKKPAENILSVWVIAKTALIADGLTTALFFVNPEKLKKEFDFEYLILYPDFTIKKSPNFFAELYYN